MATTSRHTEPMTDSYMTSLRLRNAVRTKCKIDQLGDRWLLHPDNAVTRDQHLEFRRSRAERIVTSRLEAAGFAPVRSAFHTAAMRFGMYQEPLLIQHEGGEQ